MAHFALVRNNTVETIHVLNNIVMTDDDGVEHEEWGRVFLADLHGYEPDELIQCSYNANFRGVYPGVGFTYDPDLDVFVTPIVEEPEEASGE